MISKELKKQILAQIKSDRENRGLRNIPGEVKRIYEDRQLLLNMILVSSQIDNTDRRFWFGQD